MPSACRAKTNSLGARRNFGLTDQSELAVVPGATHLFEERGALERVTQLAGNWFSAHLPDKPKGSRTA